MRSLLFILLLFPILSKAQEIKTLTLTTGDTITGKLVVKDKNFITIEKPDGEKKKVPLSMVKHDEVYLSEGDHLIRAGEKRKQSGVTAYIAPGAIGIKF